MKYYIKDDTEELKIELKIKNNTTNIINVNRNNTKKITIINHNKKNS